MLAYSYLRFCSQQQRKGDSLRRQIEARDRFIGERGLRLETSLQLQDLGVSAFRGKNRTTGALAGLLQAVEQGKVAKGSYLLVENLDRLTREQISDALELFLGILNRG
jgi:DNA invertase Pin-like site-specific DNA recombinase